MFAHKFEYKNLEFEEREDNSVVRHSALVQSSI